MKIVAFALMSFVVFNAFCQTPAKESDALQSLLIEVHQLRQDIEAMTVASQRVQIALSTLQMQDGAVTRATDRVENARSKCVAAEERRRSTASVIQNLENSTGSVPENQKEMQSRQLAQFKSMLESQTSEVQSCQTTEAEASNQLQREQAKLAEIQDRVDRLDKTLEKLSGTEK